jgi:hypothetical protein
VFPEVEKYAYQENIVSAMQKKLDNAGRKQVSLEMTGSFTFKAYRICRSKSYR